MTNLQNNAVDLLKKLIKIPSITPDIDCINYTANLLESIGFKCEVCIFDDTANLYATFGNLEKENFCFAGHTDVVPVIDLSKWKFNPFSATIDNGKLYGRGAVDMKGGIASFIAAFIEAKHLNASLHTDKHISILLTGDEEGSGANGTKKMLEYLKTKSVKIDKCLIGEPTCIHKSLDRINIGRRGSLNFDLNIQGFGGHVAHNKNIINPITIGANICSSLKGLTFYDDDLCEKTNLEIVKFISDGGASNIVPYVAQINGNIRFNPANSVTSLQDKIDNAVSLHSKKHTLKYSCTHDGYICQNLDLANIAKLKANIYSGDDVIFSTGGGVTDGSFIKHYCDQICELGPLEYMSHKIDEFIYLDDLFNLSKCYLDIILY